jgi:hypothetical protein
VDLASKELRRGEGESVESDSEEIGELEVDLSLQVPVEGLPVDLRDVLQLRQDKQRQRSGCCETKTKGEETGQNRAVEGRQPESSCESKKTWRAPVGCQESGLGDSRRSPQLKSEEERAEQRKREQR